jgi:signal transduction histidine kinase
MLVGGVMYVGLGPLVQGALQDTPPTRVIAGDPSRSATDGSGMRLSHVINDGADDRPALVIRSVTVNGKTLSFATNGPISLPAHNSSTVFSFGPPPLATNAPIRFRCQLDGYERDWHERTERMRFLVRFTDAKMEQIAEIPYAVQGQSAGWTGNFGDSTFIHRRETVPVPRNAVYYWVVITSAGPPFAVGVYAVKNLVVSQSGTNVQRLIPQADADDDPVLGGHGIPPAGWSRDGMRLRNARVVLSGPLRETTMAIVDDDPAGHTDWNSAKLKLEELKILPGDELTFEWEEAYSIGMADYGTTAYRNLPAGLYRFRMSGMNVMGLPSGREFSVPVQVPVAFWKAGWFWMAAFLAIAGLSAGGWRLSESRKMSRRIKVAERQRALEQERLRIAQDIHDDLGARVTEIALLSSAAELKANFSEEARAEFGAICRMSRELVRSLYETVWAVSPDNDHLDSLASYVCQVANEMCAQARLKCRLEVPDLPTDVPVSSHIRHNVIMVVKEFIHNSIKHAHASEIRIEVRLDGLRLSIDVSDNGRGFNPSDELRGNGLANMERRMHAAGGRFAISSSAGQGTRVHLELPVTAREP